ncbi:TonB-dependent receptor plug domain-containing protein [Thalassotalea marina]|uniref:TonB-dependent receptor n=1 Tax=Thalassotalea marina TaxID=1673741 RepID=A0A919ENE5_9GAMM|nr:TonB-dependent receptor [Thalassotalea marina]GHG01402.1 hypothetical protein GCM10017161_32610 [Thalassotalea marina]
MKNLSILAVAVKSALFAGAVTSFASVAADEQNAAEDKKIEKVTVTGSRIKRIDFEGPSPVTVLSAEDMQAAGFNNVYDALQNLTIAQGVAGEQSANSSQMAGQQINIRGLGPARALTLINGRRVTDNPTASYNSGQFFDFSIIPMAAVKRIEVLTGGGSAIYGSDAVAGVINVILKENVEDTELNLTYGKRTEGGGVQKSIQLVSGYSTDKLSSTFTFEYQEQEGLWAQDKGAFDHLNDNPNGHDGSASRIAWHYIGGGAFKSPTAETCEAMAPGSVPLPYASNYDGLICGTERTSNYSIENPRERISALANFTYDLTDDVQLFGNALAWASETNNQIFRKGIVWRGDNPYTNKYEQAYVSFSQEDFPASSFNEKETYAFLGGARGVIFDEFDWVLGVNLSRTSEYQKSRQFKQKAVTEWIQAVDYDPIQPFDTSLLSEDSVGYRWSDAFSTSRSIDFSVSGSVYELPAGPIQFSTIAEYKRDEYKIVVDPTARQGQDPEGGWTNGSASFGAGDRERFSLGVEFNVPVTEQIELGVASRYDSYHDKSETGGRLTSQASLTYRPLENLLFRTSVAESFRAPDMHHVFRARSDGFYNSGVYDFYQCRLDDTGNGNQDGYKAGCLDFTPSTGGSPRHLGIGNAKLKEEKGLNYNIGVVYEPIENLTLKLDYYDIEIENEITSESITDILKREADCRIGRAHPEDGTETYDINSEECQRTISQVEREPSDENGIGEIVRLKPAYINRSSTRQSGYDFKLTYKLTTDDWGFFKADAGYTYVDKWETTDLDVTRDIYSTLTNDDSRTPRSNLSAQLGWGYGDFYTQFTAFRKGSILREDCFRGYEEDGVTEKYDRSLECNEKTADGENKLKRLDAQWTVNMTMSYSFIENHRIILSVNNLTDHNGRKDQTEQDWPWVNRDVYDIKGRYASLRYNFKF